MSRRSMLQTGGIAAVGVWVAPSIISLDRVAAAAGSCATAPVQVDFSDYFALGYLPSTFTANDGTVVTFSMFDPSGVQDPTYAGSIWNGNMNGLDNPVVTAMSGATGGEFVRLRFDFSQPVCPSFSLVDVDRDTSFFNPFEDTVRVTGRLDGGGAINPSTITTGGAQAQINARTVRGLYSTDGTDGNVAIGFDEPINRLVIRHEDSSSLSGFQWIGVHDLHWC